MGRKRVIVPVFIPHQGCPYRCVFCNQNEITGSDRHDDRMRMDAAFETYFRESSRGEVASDCELAFYGGSFTALPESRQYYFLETAQHWYKEGLIQGIRLSTHPSAVSREGLNFLAPYPVRTIELGVQSTHPEVLRQAGRGDTLETLASATRWIQERGTALGMQLMLGLPGDSEAAFEKTVEDVISLNPDCVRIYPALVVRGTALERMYRKGEYVPWELERTLETLKMAVRRFDAEGIPVIRLGLHPEPSLLENLVAGPFHPALRSLVNSRLGCDELTLLLQKEKNIADRVVFKVPARKVSHYTGYARENRLKLKEKFSIKELVFLPSLDLKTAEILT